MGKAIAKGSFLRDVLMLDEGRNTEEGKAFHSSIFVFVQTFEI